MVVDHDLDTVSVFDIPSDWLAVHGVSPSGRLAALSLRDRVSMVDVDGSERWVVSHPSWGRGGSESGCCAFSADGALVWATVPGDDGPDEWWVIEAATGEVLSTTVLACNAAGSHAVHHPDGEWIGLSVGEGQDGSMVYWGRWHGEIELIALDDQTRVLVAVNPNGRSFLTTPHTAGAVMVHDFPSGRQVARCGTEVLEDEAWFDFDGCYIDESCVVVKVAESGVHLLLDAESLNPSGEVHYPAALGASIVGGGEGSWLTLQWPDSVLTRWVIDDSPAVEDSV